MAAQGVWSVDLAQESFTMREILAVRKVLQSFAPKLAGLCVKWHTDNQNVVFLVSVAGSLVCTEVSGWPSASQWVAYADSFRIICFGLHVASGWLARSQWVACT